jgi:hypothetical protein
MKCDICLKEADSLIGCRGHLMCDECLERIEPRKSDGRRWDDLNRSAMVFAYAFFYVFGMGIGYLIGRLWR